MGRLKKKVICHVREAQFQNRKEGWFIIELLEISLRKLDSGWLAGQNLRVPNKERCH